MTNFNSSNQDNRRYKRWEIFEYALLKFHDHDGAEAAVIVDLSLGGIQVRTKFLAQAGASMTVIITRDEEEALEIEAEVRHSHAIEDGATYATGLRFTPASAQQRIALVNYIHERFQTDMERLSI